MSDTQAIRRILDARAAQLATALAEDMRAADELEVAACTVGNERYGFPVRYLREIVPLPAITRLPHSPAWILGVAQVRGSLLSVVDLARLCTVGGPSSPRHLAVVGAPEGPIGFTVDDVLSCRLVSLALLDPEARDRAEHRAALGVTEDLLVVLDIPKLLASPELIVQ